MVQSANEVCVPLVGNLREGCGARSHQDSTASVLELLLRLIVHLEEGLCRHLLSGIVLKLPHTLALRELFLERADLGQDSNLEAAHVEEDVGIVLGVDGCKGVVPNKRCHAAGQSVLHLPEDCASQVNIMLHAPHSAISRPTHLVGVADNVLIVRIRVLCQEPLDEILGVLLAEAEDHDEAVKVSAVQSDRMPQLCVHVLEGQELVGELWRPGDL